MQRPRRRHCNGILRNWRSWSGDHKTASHSAALNSIDVENAGSENDGPDSTYPAWKLKHWEMWTGKMTGTENAEYARRVAHHVTCCVLRVSVLNVRDF